MLAAPLSIFAPAYKLQQAGPLIQHRFMGRAVKSDTNAVLVEGGGVSRELFLGMRRCRTRPTSSPSAEIRQRHPLTFRSDVL
jgi:hypothetical protein